MEQKVKVSVILITYNQQKFVRQALESILMQETNFDYEVLIGDDASTDETPQILREYKKKFPKRIRLFLRKNNVGPTKNGYSLLKSAKGLYLAFLEGDDYWIDKHKLQRQVCFLENSSEFVACAHKCIVVNENGIEKAEQIWDYPGDVFTKIELEKALMPGQTGTIVCRNIFKEKWMEYSIIYKAHKVIGDFTMVSLLLLNGGKIFRLKDVMSAYRRVSDNSDNSWSRFTSVNDFLSFESYNYFCRLEQHFKKTYDMDINLMQPKEQFFCQAVYKYLDKLTAVKLQNIFVMVKKSGSVPHYIKLIFITLIKRRIDRLIPISVQSFLKTEMETNLPDILRNASWKEFKKKVCHKRIILYGAGQACVDFLEQYYPLFKYLCIVDSDTEKWGKNLKGILIRNPEEIKNYQETIILITNAGSIKDIFRQIQKMGNNPIFSYCCMESKKWRCRLYRKL